MIIDKELKICWSFLSDEPLLDGATRAQRASRTGDMTGKYVSIIYKIEDKISILHHFIAFS